MRSTFVHGRCSFLIIPVLVTVIALSSLHPAVAAERRPPEVHVSLRDGRQLKGEVDLRTDEDMLWLRVRRERISLSTAFTWDLVQSVHAGKEVYSASEFREVAQRWASEAPRMIFIPTPAHESILLAAPQGSLQRPSVHNLQVHAVVANWDRDLALDGIELEVRPLAWDGRTIPVSGSIAVDLQGRRQMARANRREDAFPIVERWSQPVRPADFNSSRGAIYRLPFRELRPDGDLSWQSFGRVTVRLNAVTFGTFDASTFVRLRDFDPIRDQLLEYQIRHDSFDRYRGRHW